MLSPALSKPVSPTAISPVSTSNPITLCLRALNLHTTTHQPANKEAEKVEAAVRVALSDQRTEPEAIAIILNNAFVHGYVPVLNNMILQIKKADKDQTIPITDKVIEILYKDGIALTVKEDGQIEMRKRTSTFSTTPLHDSLVASTLVDVFPKDIIGLIHEEDSRQYLPMDSNGRIRFNTETSVVLIKVLALGCANSEENRNIKRQIIEHAIEQGKELFLNEILANLAARLNQNHRLTRINRVDLYKMDLSRLDLHKINLSCVDLSYANLSHANLDQGNMSRSILVGANLYKAKMRQTFFAESDLDGAIMDEVLAGNTFFDGSSMRGVFMRKANISRSTMIAYNPDDPGFPKSKRTDLTKGNMISTNLTGADMTGAIAIGTKFNDAILRGVDFTNVKADGAEFDDAILDDAILINTNLTGANLSEVHSAQGMAIDEQTKSTLSWRSGAHLKLSGVFSSVKHVP